MPENSEEQRWRYDIYYEGGGRLGGCPTTTRQMLREVQRATLRAFERIEIRPYELYLASFKGVGKPKDEGLEPA